MSLTEYVKRGHWLVTVVFGFIMALAAAAATAFGNARASDVSILKERVTTGEVSAGVHENDERERTARFERKLDQVADDVSDIKAEVKLLRGRR